MTLKKVLGFVLVIFPATVALVFGCMKRPPESVDKGVEVQCSAVDEAEQKLAAGSISNIAEGEFSSDVTTQQLADMQPFPVHLHSVEVLTVTSDSLWLRDTKQPVKSTGELGEKKVVDYHYNLRPSTASMNLMQKSYSQKKSLLEAFGVKPSSKVTTMSSNCDYGASFHNLKTETVLVPIPDTVKTRTLCGYLQNGCERPILATQMSVDLWFKLNDGKSEQKFTLLTLMSSEVPYFASVLKNCVQQPVQQEEHANPVVVTQCTEVKDFKFGQDPWAATRPTPTPTP